MIFHTNCVLCAMPRMAHGGKWAKLLRVFPTGADLRLQEKNREREKSTVLVWGPSPSMGPQPVGIPLSAQGWPCGVCSQPACVHGRPGLLLRRGCLTWAEQTGRWVHLGAAPGGCGWWAARLVHALPQPVPSYFKRDFCEDSLIDRQSWRSVMC